MSLPARQELAGRSCPRCRRRADRVARHWLDRVLSLFMPVARYRCASSACGWEGVLMRRHALRHRRAPRRAPSNPHHPEHAA